MLTGNGKAFCSGADLKAGFEPAEDGFPDVGSALRDHFHPIIEGLKTMPKPTIAAINGPAVGIGLSFALACDLALAAESSYLMLAFVNIGLVPDGGARFLIPERIGYRPRDRDGDARREGPGAEGARVGPDQPRGRRRKLTDEARKLADQLANGPTRSYAGSKRQLNEWSFARCRTNSSSRRRSRHEVGQDRRLHRGSHGVRGEAGRRDSAGPDRQ